MAIPPTLIFAFTLIPYFPIYDSFIHELFSLIRDIVPGEKNNSVIIDFLNDFLTSPRNELLSFGLFLALIFSSNAMMGVMRSFNKNYPGFRKRSTLEKRKIALLLTITVFVLVFVTLFLLIAQSAVLKWIGVEPAWLRTLILNVRWVIIFFLFFFIVSFIYRHGAATVKRWPYLTPGAIFSTTLMVISSALVTFWVNHFSNYNTIYGSLGAIFILMLFIYVNSLAILIGFELNVTLMNLIRKMIQAPALENQDKGPDNEKNG
jgi:membrane protein